MCGGGSRPKPRPRPKPKPVAKAPVQAPVQRAGSKTAAADAGGDKGKKAKLLGTKRTGPMGVRALPFMIGKSLFGA